MQLAVLYVSDAAGEAAHRMPVNKLRHLEHNAHKGADELCAHVVLRLHIVWLMIQGRAAMNLKHNLGLHWNLKRKEVM